MNGLESENGGNAEEEQGYERGGFRHWEPSPPTLPRAFYRKTGAPLAAYLRCKLDGGFQVSEPHLFICKLGQSFL